MVELQQAFLCDDELEVDDGACLVANDVFTVQLQGETNMIFLSRGTLVPLKGGLDPPMLFLRKNS